MSRQAHFSLPSTTLTLLIPQSTTVGCGYMCLLFSDDRVKADKYVGYIWGAKGMSALGGALTLGFKSSLFLPLWPAAALNILAFFAVYLFVTEPRRTEETDDKLEQGTTTEGEEKHMREKVPIILGAILNCLGSTGFTRMFKCKLHFFGIRLSPLPQLLHLLQSSTKPSYLTLWNLGKVLS